MMNASHYGHGAAIRAWLYAVLAILLNACSGGISGTGDGGPIIIVNNIETTLDTGIGDIADGPDGSADGGTDGAVDGATDGTTDGATVAPTDSVPPESLALPERIYLTLPATLVASSSADVANEQPPVPTAYQPLRAALGSAINLLLDAQVLVDLVGTQFTDSVALCDADTDCVDAQLDTVYLYDAQILERDLARRVAVLDPNLPASDRLSLETTLREQLGARLNTTVALTISDYRAMVSTAVQQNMRISSGDATLDITWRPQSDTSSIRYARAGIIVHAKLDGADQRFTLRLYDRVAATLLAASFEPIANGILFEADLHRANDAQAQRYLRGYSDAQSGTLLARDPAADSTARQRERYLSSGQLVSVQICTSDCGDAALWTEQLSNALDSDAQFESFATQFGQFEQTIADDIMIDNLAASIDEWVVSSGGVPDEAGGNTLCSGQRVGGDLRHFCWTMEIAPSTAQVYREALQRSGELVYTQVQ